MSDEPKAARAPSLAIARPLEVGQHFDRYRIDGVLGRGAMGMVYRATDTTLDRAIALKLLEPEHGIISNEARARFAREARAAAALTHENVVALFEYGEVAERPFLAMELVVGTMLRKATTGYRSPCGSAGSSRSREVSPRPMRAGSSTAT